MKDFENNDNKKNNIVIYTNEIKKRGIFFRSPIQKVSFHEDFDDTYPFEVYHYIDSYKKSVFRRFYERLIGNGKIIKNGEKWSKEENFYGFSANILVFPIYFWRKERILEAVSYDDTLIKKVKSHGYESRYNDCSGACTIEKTTVYLKDGLRKGKKIHICKKGEYHFTYSHITEKIFETNEIE